MIQKYFLKNKKLNFTSKNSKIKCNQPYTCYQILVKILVKGSTFLILLSNSDKMLKITQETYFVVF